MFGPRSPHGRKDDDAPRRREADPGTLQDCIDTVAQPGDTIQIETNEIIDEFPVVAKSLTLQAGQGFHPIVSKGGQVGVNSGTIAVTISGITFGDSLEVELLGGSGHSVSLDHVKVLQGSQDDEDLAIDAKVAGSVSVTGSTFQGQARDDRIGMDADQTSGLVTFRVIGNRVTGHGDATSGAGISLLLRSSGSTRADIDNNSAWDVARNRAGINSGLAVPRGPGRPTHARRAGRRLLPLNRHRPT